MFVDSYKTGEEKKQEAFSIGRHSQQHEKSLTRFSDYDILLNLLKAFYEDKGVTCRFRRAFKIPTKIVRGSRIVRPVICLLCSARDNRRSIIPLRTPMETRIEECRPERKKGPAQ